MTVGVTVCALLLYFFGLLSFVIYANMLERKSLAYMERLSGQILVSMDRNIYDLVQHTFVTNYDDVLNSHIKRTIQNHTMYDTIFSEFVKKINLYFYNLLSSQKELHAFYIYRLDGDMLYSVNRDRRAYEYASVYDEEWFHNAIEAKGRPVIMGGHINTHNAENARVIAVARAITDNSTQMLLGVIVAEQNVSKIESLVADIQMEQKGSIRILDAAGKPLFGKEPLEIQSKSVSDRTGWQVIVSMSREDMMNDDTAIFRGITLLVIAGAGLSVLIVFLIIKMNSLTAREYSEKLLRKEAELKLLQKQINPHFLYNTLGSISYVAETEDAPLSAEMIQTLSRLMRYTLRESSSLVTIRQEIDYIRDYLILMQNRYGDRFQVVYEIDENCLNHKIPIISLQPLVENAILHGFHGWHTDGLIKIAVYRNDDEVTIDIHDNGAGMTEEEIKRLEKDNGRTHIGLAIVKARIHALFGNESGLALIQNDNTGITARITLKGGTPNEDSGGG